VEGWDRHPQRPAGPSEADKSPRLATSAPACDARARDGWWSDWLHVLSPLSIAWIEREERLANLFAAIARGPKAVPDAWVAATLANYSDVKTFLRHIREVTDFSWRQLCCEWLMGEAKVRLESPMTHVADVAKALGYSERGFHRAFEARFGIGPKQYQLRARQTRQEERAASDQVSGFSSQTSDS
jgi:AraC-like DNA-binding protein